MDIRPIGSAIVPSAAFTQPGYPLSAISYISQGSMTATADSNYGGYPPSNVLDNNLGTAWQPSTSEPPHYLILDLGSAQTFSGILIKKANGTAVELWGKIYVSDDGATWGSSIADLYVKYVAAGMWVLFAPQTKQYIKILIDLTENSSNWINILEVLVSTNADYYNTNPLCRCDGVGRTGLNAVLFIGSEGGGTPGGAAIDLPETMIIGA